MLREIIGMSIVVRELLMNHELAVAAYISDEGSYIQLCSVDKEKCICALRELGPISITRPKDRGKHDANWEIAIDIQGIRVMTLVGYDDLRLLTMADITDRGEVP